MGLGQTRGQRGWGAGREVGGTGAWGWGGQVQQSGELGGNWRVGLGELGGHLQRSGELGGQLEILGGSWGLLGCGIGGRW